MPVDDPFFAFFEKGRMHDLEFLERFKRGAWESFRDVLVIVSYKDFRGGRGEVYIQRMVRIDHYGIVP